MQELSYTENSSNTKPVLLLQAWKIMLICAGMEKKQKLVACKNHGVKHSTLMSAKNYLGILRKQEQSLKKKK